MRVLLVVRNHGYLRNFSSTIAELTRRGHEIVFASRGAERHMATDMVRYAADLCARCPGLRVDELPRRRDAWAKFAWKIRAWRNALRYQHPRFTNALKLRERARRHLARTAPALLQALPAWWPAASVCLRLGAALERAIPTDPAVDAAVRAIAPDAIVVSPLVDFNSYQTDYVKTARHLGIPVGLAVASWDNLTNKGLIAIEPDRVFVWNDAQRREAVSLHDIPRERIEVTGAPLFDTWFAGRPTTDRDQFCHRIGLDPSRPYVLYLCSSLFIADTEVAFVARWLDALRHSGDPTLGHCGVLVRPHPGNAGPWADFPDSAQVRVWPRAGALPLDRRDQGDYYDSLYHAGAVVGLNTTALIEAGIVGRRSFTVLDPAFAETQSGTLHFGYLTEDAFVTTATDLATHATQLAHELAVPSAKGAFDRFLTSFVRPLGLDVAATPILADAFERLGALPAARAVESASTRLLRTWLQRRLAPRGGRARSPAVD